jgi:prepilin signal peptidase PulO-like enzyme (type II secretory pathway)
MRLTRINVCTLVLAVVLAALITPVYTDLVAQIPATVSSMFRWLVIGFLYAVQGASALYGARFLARWIFAHATREKSASH